MDKLSYALGLSIAGNLKNSGVETIDVESFTNGIKHVVEGVKPEITQEEATTLINEFFAAVNARQFEKNIKEGESFLAENAKREGVTTLESGLQYEILTEGNGKTPGASDQVKCHYHGTLIDGTVFDSSVQRGEPAVFPVGGVIAGWVEALQLMPIGSKWKLFVPANLAYGEHGAGQQIEPHKTLVFEVELLEIV